MLLLSDIGNAMQAERNYPLGMRVSIQYGLQKLVPIYHRSVRSNQVFK